MDSISTLSTKNLYLLPAEDQLQKISKAISVLDAIFCQDWEYRYYSYNSKWGEQEECFERRDGQGDHMLILFTKYGCIINGFAHEYKQQDKLQLTKGLPACFNQFIYEEPVKTIGTTFCLWKEKDKIWQTGEVGQLEDNSEEMLNIFDGKQQTYIDWAAEYFEKEEISKEIVSQIYKGDHLTREMVVSLEENLEDWDKLKEDLKEINYPYNF